MKLFKKMKDGGPDSKVTGYFLIEWKRVLSIALLRFDRGSREVYHNHAFNSISWVLWGWLGELYLGTGTHSHRPSIFPVLTKRSTFHKVYGMAPSTWVLTFRGPWGKTWDEVETIYDQPTTLTHGREVVS